MNKLTLSTYAFFNLSANQDLNVVDEFWKVTPQQLVNAMEVLFNTYVPIEMPELFNHLNKQPFWNVMNTLTNETLPITNTFTNTNAEPMAIAIVGEMHHGKSTVAQYLSETYHLPEYAFAGPLKQGCRVIFELTDDQLFGTQKEVVDPRWGVSPRYLFQRVGTELFRKHLQTVLPELKNSENIWIANYKKFCTNLQGAHIVSDARFCNEVDFIRQFNKRAIVVRVVRPSMSNRSGNVNQHTSETEQKAIQHDVLLQNDGTLQDLFSKVDHFNKNYLC